MKAVRGLFRQVAITCLCLGDFARLLCLQAGKCKAKIVGLFALVCVIFAWKKLFEGPAQMGVYFPHAVVMRSSPASSAPRSSIFSMTAGGTMYLYSAIANDRYPLDGETNVIITGLSRDGLPSHCCVVLDNTTIYTSLPEEFETNRRARFSELPVVRDIAWYFLEEPSRAVQVTCAVPNTGHRATHATLSFSACSQDTSGYLPVQRPSAPEGSMAVCAKIAHGNGLDPEKVIEWFELQMLLGVSKVLMYDLGVTDPVKRVLNYYQRLGFLDLQPYELVGPPRNRSLSEKFKRMPQFSHDETLSVYDCRQRLMDYTFVLGHDLDELVIPRQDVTLPEFFKAHLETYQDAAGFEFDTEFFIYNWGASSPKEDLMVTRFQRCTLPHRECTKYVYLPRRVHSVETHNIFPRKLYKVYRLPKTEAILHHYRRCPDDVWPTCEPDTIIDDVMMRYKHKLLPRVQAVRRKTDTKTQWDT
ncbi:uncharacterized protein LOC106013507 [Aplysia californica]|uniref:Glycosyltransferase family 92 protein n=1 Tax=Aplysia californica TaxID=6500 RepID=A0ABM1AC44_APLCA|nr:uncharacterized protein LOC106013507 [Aplysia californica]XP_012944883.1 uncharacterized protein LOC106013507 [Aplysia californica]